MLKMTVEVYHAYQILCTREGEYSGEVEKAPPTYNTILDTDDVAPNPAQDFWWRGGEVGALPQCYDLIIYEMLRKKDNTTERQSNTTQLAPKQSFFKFGCLRWDSTYT